MRWLALYNVISTLLHLWRLLRSTSVDKDLEILLLRHQLSIYERKYDHQIIRPSRPDKVLLTSLTNHLRRSTLRTIQQLQSTIRIVKPETVIGWHRQLVKRKWTYRSSRGGRPRTDRELEKLTCQLARENDWGYERIQGELIKLGFDISVPTVANILKRHGIPPLPERTSSLSWQHLMSHYCTVF
jgi:putative transposase